MLASELNALWAAKQLPYRLDYRGVGQLWAVCQTDGDTKPPVLFIIGKERQAVMQAHRWGEVLRVGMAVEVGAPRT